MAAHWCPSKDLETLMAEGGTGLGDLGLVTLGLFTPLGLALSSVNAPI